MTVGFRSYIKSRG